MDSVEPVSPDRTLASDIVVLHVDDDEQFRRATELKLGREPNITEIVSVDSVDAALDRYADEGTDIDCIVSDYELRDRTGIDLLRIVRDDDHNLPFIVFTGTGSEDVASDALSAGATNYLQKGSDDIRFAVLARHIRQAVENRRAEKEIHRGFKAIEITDEGIALVTRDFEFNYVNEAFANLFGYDQNELLGNEWDCVIPEEVTAHVEPEFEPPMDQWETETTVTEPDGTEMTLHVTVSPITNDGFVCAVEDVTERKEREAALERENERLDQFASMVSHDLRNPINIVELYTEEARKTGDEEYFDEIEAATDRMKDIVSDLLTLAHMEEVETDDTVSLSALADETWANTATENASLENELGDARIVASEPRLKELFANLYRNVAAHAGDDVTVRTGRTADGFFVEDDGVGIPEAEREQVLEAGYSTGGTTGFGLTIVGQVATTHGWTFEISESEAGGARFEFGGVEFRS
ncbi:PAS domain S-box protein [Halomicroarcula limicola]|uniref:histidine kinase n=1 Tax=Haloarcula limicola TaxID=1429915 RepID=A0A8J7Y701_9EURY|nr:PAS domain S-box protein [Halomicroarcula limicola]MBV0922839.1 PAS domain S-box protein [Halomicroarcula limicola]